MTDHYEIVGTYHYFCVVHNAEVYQGRNLRAMDDLCMIRLRAYSEGKDANADFIFAYGKIVKDQGDAVQFDEIQVLASNKNEKKQITRTYHKGWIVLGERVAKAKLKGFKKPVRKRGLMVMY